MSEKSIAYANGMRPFGLPHAGDLLLRSGKLRDVGAVTADERVDLHGGFVLPGLVDSHVHLENFGKALRELDVRNVTSLDGLQAAIAGARPDANGWIQGRGWDQTQLGLAVFPSRFNIDSACEHPVWLTRVDGHAALLNTKALSLLGVEPTGPDPAGGSYERNHKGELTGILIDRAMDEVAARLPAPGFSQIREDILSAALACAQAGLVGVHEIATEPAAWEALVALDQEGRLPVRVCAFLFGKREELAPIIEARYSSPHLTIGGIKLFSDGALGSYGAWLHEPYADKDTRGLQLATHDELRREVAWISGFGLQAAVHAIGDAAATLVLDVFEEVAQQHPAVHHRIEHCQLIRPQDYPRMAKLQVMAACQPIHCTQDMRWIEERIGHTRASRAYPSQTLAQAGVGLRFGSDAPVESVNPWWGLHAAVTRQDAEGHPKAGWHPQECVSRRQALAAYCVPTHTAKPTGDGPMAVGDWADFTVADRNPLEASPLELRDTRVLRTVVGGEIVFERESSSP